MEARAPYHTPAPNALRNLAQPIAAWLRTQGFTATEHHQYTVLVAHWTGSRGEHFQFTYDWVAGTSPDATCRLQVYQPGEARYDVLFTAQRVRRLRDVRRLLLGNVRYANARTLATLPHPAL
ncbi:hypothetical protein GO988_15400 [Hymenobacter sp. HMF4947]|uniref:Uncharacterized protein n=1 Tax=Hymenobacter ginkgonis TaxID=2682976 RepID=A0A7K1TH44_9BACT|nr:hypothetical protein [Hymenobacter ginkgonis]MVN77718.1 hypothetical protein [Hymenobacter ginkgonis]